MHSQVVQHGSIWGNLELNWFRIDNFWPITSRFVSRELQERIQKKTFEFLTRKVQFRLTLLLIKLRNFKNRKTVSLESFSWKLSLEMRFDLGYQLQKRVCRFEFQRKKLIAFSFHLEPETNFSKKSIKRKQLANTFANEPKPEKKIRIHRLAAVWKHKIRQFLKRFFDSDICYNMFVCLSD